MLTRLPPGLAVPAADAADVLVRRFDGLPLGLSEAGRVGLPGRLPRAGVFGGASYDGLVGVEAQSHGRVPSRSIGAPGRPTVA